MNTMEFTSAMRAEQYHREQLDDYYQEQNRAICQFGGRLAPQLGLSGEFDPIKFRDALYGKFGNHEWVNRPGEHSNAAIDCHLAPPKSVTLMALVAGDERIVAAHQKAVQTALKSLERLSMTRVSANKETKSEYIGKLAWASFQHETARAVDGTDPDPQLHTHSLIFNAVLCADGKLRTLDAREMLRARLEVDSIYKTELVRYLKSFGYNLVMTEKAFEIDGISQEVIDEFSRRSQQVVGNLKEMGLTRETASGLARQVAALQNRLAKVAGEIYVRALIVAGWKDRAAAIQALQIPNPDIQEQLATEQKIQPAQQEKASEMEIAAAQEAPLSPATPTEKGNNDGNELRPKFYAEQFTDPHPARQTSNLQELSLLNMDALHQRSAMLLPRTASDVVQVKPARNDDIGMRRPIDGDTPTNRGSDVDQFGKNDRDHAARSADERSDGGRRDGDGRNLNADEAIAHALADMTERDSVITSPSALIAGAAHASHYTLSNESLHVALQKAVSRGQVILGDQGKLALVEAIQRGEVAMRPTGKLTTKAIMDAEESYLKAYKNGLESRNPMADSAVIAKEINEVEQKLAARAAARGIKSDGKLTAGQRRFVEAVCTSKDAIVICEGDAGTGKSTAVEAILAISNASGHKTIGLAPTTKAVAALEQSGVPTVTTKSALLSEKFWKEVDEKTLIILDEAGLVPAKDMADLTRRVEERGGQIVPTGDTKQFRSVQSGTPLSQ
ncbi:MAG: MobF family relaxase, partial [Burkholderiaceae bacterium]